MKLNSKANQVRNLDLSENKKEDIEMKQDMLEILKKKTGYAKDMEAAKPKRTRRTKIQELAGDDPEKIIALKKHYIMKKKRKISIFVLFHDTKHMPSFGRVFLQTSKRK